MRPHLELLEVQIPEGSRGHKAFSVIRGFGWSYHTMILKAGLYIHKVPEIGRYSLSPSLSRLDSCPNYSARERRP
jgi:hypothetical protein